MQMCAVENFVQVLSMQMRAVEKFVQVLSMQMCAVENFIPVLSMQMRAVDNLSGCRACSNEFDHFVGLLSMLNCGF